jgi:ribonuclease Z
MGRLQQGETITLKGKKIKPGQATYNVKGRKIAVVSDTTPCENCYKLAQDADILICESAYTSKLEAKALQYKHMTAKEAALIASRANSKQLVLTHFSARYKNTLELQEEAQTIFDNVRCAEDFMKIRI